jgi:hypothetical protein
MNKGKTLVEEIKVPTVYLDNVPVSSANIVKSDTIELEESSSTPEWKRTKDLLELVGSSPVHRPNLPLLELLFSSI